MTVAEIKVIAKEMGVKTSNMKKVDLIRAIQRAEGNPLCFETHNRENCGQEICMWRRDCN
ncbi:Rho termination factor N-terminal domain-containing protein [uncultured Desulfuromonas sp.]|uniref:Rho termination factor N-terminal domain-containing protein n=1 Tax=uncultured Desulfuromonas sp. TaxID=181013 RepID=UPI002AAC2A71|nr:Rho termination factor N-terminal domain-containing protein [uncultured Desulfuromonas sp.]